MEPYTVPLKLLATWQAKYEGIPVASQGFVRLQENPPGANEFYRGMLLTHPGEVHLQNNHVILFYARNSAATPYNTIAAAEKNSLEVRMQGVMGPAPRGGSLMALHVDAYRVLEKP